MSFEKKEHVTPGYLITTLTLIRLQTVNEILKYDVNTMKLDVLDSIQYPSSVQETLQITNKSQKEPKLVS